MPYKPSIRTGVALLATAAVGAGAGVIGSAAARPGHQASSGARATAATPRAAPRRGRMGRRGLRGPARRAVHIEAVVPKPGGGFATATIDRGVVTKVDGSTVSLRQGTRKGTWRTHDFTVPTDARVVVDHRRGDLSGAKAGQIAIVAQLPRRTVVRVHDRRR